MAFKKGENGRKKVAAVPPPENPEGETPKLTGSPSGYAAMAEKSRVGTGRAPSFLSDPAVREALKGDAAIEREIEAEAEAEILLLDEVLENLEDEPTGGHPFANGSSIPFPYKGADTVNFATCSKPRKDENRGCPVYAHCPLRDRGPFLLSYLNKRARNQIRHITCVDFLKTHMVFQPWIVLLPGINWEGTLTAEYTLDSRGRMPEMGPGKTKTPIKLMATKSMSPEELFPPVELVKEYTRLRRRGEIQPWQS
jgi:hypothetical protein